MKVTGRVAGRLPTRVRSSAGVWFYDACQGKSCLALATRQSEIKKQGA